MTSAYIDAEVKRLGQPNVVRLFPDSPLFFEPAEPNQPDAHYLRRFATEVQRTYLEAHEKGYQAGLTVGRVRVVQAAMMVSVAWVAVFGIALVWWPI